MNFINNILNLIYPPVCGFCNKINQNNICKKCELKIRGEMICNVDYYYNKNFNKHIYIFKYESLIRDKIVQYKFNNKSYMYKSFANLIVKDKKIYNFLKSYDIIVPVPISKKRKKERGYNQCELIAKDISKKMHTLKLGTDILYKIVNNAPQSTLSKFGRTKNVKDVYNLNKNCSIVKDKKIILFDDVYTTGSTANECSKLLKIAGAQRIDVLTIAKD